MSAWACSPTRRRLAPCSVSSYSSSSSLSSSATSVPVLPAHSAAEILAQALTCALMSVLCSRRSVPMGRLSKSSTSLRKHATPPSVHASHVGSSTALLSSPAITFLISLSTSSTRPKGKPAWASGFTVSQSWPSGRVSQWGSWMQWSLWKTPPVNSCEALAGITKPGMLLPNCKPFLPFFFKTAGCGWPPWLFCSKAATSLWRSRGAGCCL
mmetsp:Transcript_17378/g.48238  ORF Transcript_17378/g.48238 Transcript_17378/m.48238 type:complete len:211 (+) Transcript_17378:372-1004(+)